MITTKDAIETLEAIKERLKTPDGCAAISPALRDKNCECFLCTCDRLIQHLYEQEAMYANGILKVVANVRRLAFREAAKLMCSFCNSNNPWSDAKILRAGDGYEHYEMGGGSKNTRPCEAAEIWEKADAEDPGRHVESEFMELRKRYAGRLWMSITGWPTEITVEMFPSGSDMVIGKGLWHVTGTYFLAMERAIERCKLDEKKEAEAVAAARKKSNG